MHTNWGQFLLVYLFFIGVLAFVWNKGYLLASLINLEYMALIVFLSISLLYMCNDQVVLALAYLAISVCEGALGLGVLVAYARGSGGDYMSSVGLSSW